MMSPLSELTEKIASGQPVTPEDARRLAETSDLVTVGTVATEARRARVGNGVTFVRVAEIAHDAPMPGASLPGASPQDAPRRDASPQDSSPQAAPRPGATAPEEISSQAGMWPSSAGEIRITGTPASAEEAIAAVDRVATAAAAAAAAAAATGSASVASSGSAAIMPVGSTPVAPAGSTPITAFALTDLWTLSGGNARQLEALVRGLKEAGACGVADVALDVLAAADFRQALDIVLAGGLLAPVARWRQTPADPIAAFAALRSLQAATQAFRAVAPLPTQRPASSEAPSTGYDDVKLVAVARVMLDNIEQVQVDWAMYGPKLAQVALLFGASDLDRVSPQDDSPLGHRRAPLEEVRRNITAAFLQPLERDGRFERVAR